ncbi:rod-binding protein [Desulfobotulus sp. H1]|uniref:Rod-binding protein n=1 Tax=Desulfobotulus pelophilus TaxID=2823377 RepID=A0ABT3N4J3_9BACT|nr:rod-binding protein [Desulfobotulus pelophilus]MCW7752378.1 rod-binding protein [Desulfobotulus pelophilus]
MRLDSGVQMAMVSESRIAGDVKAAAKIAEKERLKEACAGFEAIMLQTMMKAMRQTLPEGGIFNRSQAEEIWESRMDEELADRISRGHNSPGLRDFLYRQLARPDSEG